MDKITQNDNLWEEAYRKCRLSTRHIQMTKIYSYGIYNAKVSPEFEEGNHGLLKSKTSLIKL